jgi:two-component system NtrC family sensor kinase
MKSFSRMDAFDLKLSDINEGLETTIILMKGVITDKIKIVKNLNKLPEIMCVPGKLNQVFMNIINNAAQAVMHKSMPSGTGRIFISSCVENDQVIIIIKDNGIGMSDETIKKIFDPFFTKKSSGQGTGLGMSISYTIIKNHHGEIRVESTEGIGSQFTIILPLA